jgi:hypothetical protein
MTSSSGFSLIGSEMLASAEEEEGGRVDRWEVVLLKAEVKRWDWRTAWWRG